MFPGLGSIFQMTDEIITGGVKTKNILGKNILCQHYDKYHNDIKLREDIGRQKYFSYLCLNFKFSS